MRKFNTAGPVRAGRHYLVPPLERFDLAEVLAMVRDEAYFVLHAPRQTGKTSALLALRNLLNGGSTGDISGADAGHLVIFDMREGRSWEERIAPKSARPPTEDRSPSGGCDGLPDRGLSAARRRWGHGHGYGASRSAPLAAVVVPRAQLLQQRDRGREGLQPLYRSVGHVGGRLAAAVQGGDVGAAVD